MTDDSPYERVTDPERFTALHRVADELVQQLQEHFDVLVEAVAPEGGHHLRPQALSAVRVSPRNGGAAVTITRTAFPGLYVRFGSEHTEAFPSCGCDACDEQPGAVADDLREKVRAVTRGRFSEPPGGYEFVYDDGVQSGQGRTRRSWRRLPTRRYEPWPPLGRS